MDAEDIEKRRLAAEQQTGRREEQLGKEQIKKERAETSMFSRLAEKITAAPGQAKDTAAEHAKSGMPFLFFIFGLVIYIIDLIRGGNNLNIAMLVAAGSIFLLFTVLTSLKNIRKGIRNLIYLVIAILFEIGYYTLLTRYVGTIPWQLSRTLGWNGFILAAGISGFNQEKTYWKFIVYYFVVLLLLMLLNPLTTALGQTFGFVKTTEIEEGSKESVLKGIAETGTSWIDDITCATNPEPDKCAREKKWDRIRDKEPELATAMKELCENDDPDCDCYVYLGKQRDDCLQKQAETAKTEKEIAGGTKQKIPMEVSFEIPKDKNSYGPKARIDTSLKILSPYKQIQITADCTIENKTQEISSTLNDAEEPIFISAIQTEETAQSRRVSCASKENVDPGDYKFNLTATINGIKTEAYYIGLFATPASIQTGGTQFQDILNTEMKDAYGGNKVQSFSDPDFTLLNFLLVPDYSLVEENKVSALNTEENYKHFTIEVSLENNKAGSRITSVDSIEFKIPNMFTPDTSCLNSYNLEETEGDSYWIKARTDVLKEIKFDRITKGKTPTRISALNCRLSANKELQDSFGITPLRFDGAITYSQQIQEKATVKQVG